MTMQMTVNLAPEKACQHLLKYFETRDDIKVKASEPHFIQVRTLGSRHPWINIKIGMFGDGDRTRLAFDFNFRIVYTVLATITAVGIALALWVIPHPMIDRIVLTATILTCASITFAYEITKAKRKFIDDVRKVFDLLNKAD